MPTTTGTYEKLFQANGIYITRAISIVPQTATTTFYTVTGLVALYANILEVTTAIQAQANAIKWVHTPTGGAVGDASGTIDINAFAVGDFIVMQGPTDAGANSQSPTRVGATGGNTGLTLLTRPIALRAGALGLNAAASNTGNIRGHLFWKPLLPGSKITPA